MIEPGLNPEDLLGKRFGHHLDFWSLSEGRLMQRIDLGDEHALFTIRQERLQLAAWRDERRCRLRKS